MTSFFKDEYATVELDESVPCIKLTLTGLPKHSEHYQSVQSKRLELMRREINNYPLLHMFTDSRLASPVLDEDVNYFKCVVLPQMEKAGIRYLAIVMPLSKFTWLTINEMTEAAQSIEVKYFEQPEEATSWLRTKTPKSDT